MDFWLAPPGQDVLLHPLAFAGWVGLLLTSLNLFPIGQLDGGHVLYAILRRNSWRMAELGLIGCVLAILFFGKWMWSVMIVLLIFMGPRHPPTANDAAPLGWWRTVLGAVDAAVADHRVHSRSVSIRRTRTEPARQHTDPRLTAETRHGLGRHRRTR